MKKKTGFTLVEILISISLLTVVLSMAGTVFGVAIQQPNKLKPIIQGKSVSYSKMDDALYEAKSIEKSFNDMDNVDGNSLTALVGDDTKHQKKYNMYHIKVKDRTVNGVIGQLISYDEVSDSIKRNKDVRVDHALHTFVGQGHWKPVVSTIKDLHLAKPASRFSYFPLNEASKELQLNYKVDNSQLDPYGHGIALNTFKNIRLRFLISKLDQGDALFTPYLDDQRYFDNRPALNSSLFDYIFQTSDSDSLDNNNVQIIKGYQLSKNEYLDAIDHSFGGTGVTLNKNGHISPPFETFYSNDPDGLRSAYIIGLPYIDKLLAHYDYNLVASKSILSGENNKYYSLFDLLRYQKTAYSTVVTADASNPDLYHFDWKNFDVRTFLGMGGPAIQNINIKTGFLNTKVFNATDSFGSEDGLDVQKPYGNTVKYKIEDSAVAEIKASRGKSYTFLAKVNFKNYNPNSNAGKYAPFSLLSFNYSADGTMMDLNRGGFSLYLDQDGKLKRSVQENDGTPDPFENKDTGFDINSTLLYENGNFVLSSLTRTGNNENQDRDGREDFNIMAFVIHPRSASGDNEVGVKVYFLKQMQENGKLKTEMIKVDEFEVEISNAGDPFNNGKFEFVKQIKAIGKNITEREELPNLDDSMSESVVEISDMILYEEDLSTMTFAPGKSYLNVTMDYLYRKFLTEHERKNGGFDEFFMNKH